jgi:S-adenosylmethionine synthetase
LKDSNVHVEHTLLAEPTGDLLDVEVVECKGLGHPDTICDQLVEQVSLALSRYYRAQFGRILHYNVDKALLWGGESAPAFGGGRILKPMEFFLSGRATVSAAGVEVPLQILAEQAMKQWLGAHMPLVDLRDHFKMHCLVRPGSADLAELFDRQQTAAARLSNDTSCGVGFAPFSRLETLVYEVEQELGSLGASSHPEFGRDIKIMGIRRGDQVDLTVACAFVDRFLSGIEDYQAKKRVLADTVRAIAGRHGVAAAVTVNAADRPEGGSIYMTVTGTSAESGDDGQAGRGNRVNGLITPFRPMTMESVAGKNAVTHVGKLYNLAAGIIAERVVIEVPGIAEAHCLLVSGIGRPVAAPQMAAIRLRPTGPSLPANLDAKLASIVQEELAGLETAADALAAGRLRIGAWPLRVPVSHA